MNKKIQNLLLALLSLTAINASAEESRFAQAEQLKNTGYYAKANRIYFLALRKDNADTEALYGLSDSFLRHHEYDNAEKKLNKLLAINSSHEDGLMLRAYLYALQEKWSQSIADYKTVIDMNPNRVDAYRNIKSAYTGAGDTESADAAGRMYESLKSKG
jgi:tetratricopeptide (TPR) repeat protein